MPQGEFALLQLPPAAAAGLACPTEWQMVSSLQSHFSGKSENVNLFDITPGEGTQNVKQSKDCLNYSFFEALILNYPQGSKVIAKA